jgi:hypothetical protein
MVPYSPCEPLQTWPLNHFQNWLEIGPKNGLKTDWKLASKSDQIWLQNRLKNAIKTDPKIGPKSSQNLQEHLT